MSVFKDFLAFAGKYADEAAAVGNALDDIVNALPIQQQDKARILGYVEIIQRAPTSIAGWIEGAKEPTPVTIKKADIEKAVAAVLPGILNDTVTAAVTEALAKMRADALAEFEADRVAREADAAGDSADDDGKASGTDA